MSDNNRKVLNIVGKTPCINLTVKELPKINLLAKLEYMNPTGSVKDRAASYIIETLLAEGTINTNTIIVESTSGNFGIALSSYCRKFGLPFYCVIDPLITSVNEQIILALSEKVFKVTQRDRNGGYLLNRINKVKELLNGHSNIYWINQYQNPLNAAAYYRTLGAEIVRQNDNKLDYIFIGVSSGGTITGLSQRLKEDIPSCKVIAVDIEGSVIFGGKPSKRFIPGIGSSLKPEILKYARIDDVVYVDEMSTLRFCNRLLKEHNVFVGGSSGSVLAAIYKYFTENPVQSESKVMILLCDRGDRYASTIYNEEWVSQTYVNYSFMER